MIYVIDAWAWIEYLIGSDYGSKIRDIIEDETNEIFTCSLTISEIISVTKRENRDFNSAYKIILSNSKNFDISPKLAREAGILHAEIKKKIKDFGLADAFVLTTSRILNAKLVTGDSHFKSFNNVILIK